MDVARFIRRHVVKCAPFVGDAGTRFRVEHTKEGNLARKLGVTSPRTMTEKMREEIRNFSGHKGLAFDRS